MLLTVVTERTPFVVEAERMKLEPLDKGFTEMSLHFGFAEGPAVPPALEAHRAEFPIDIAETSFFLGRETPVPTVRSELSVWREKLYAFMGRNAVSASDYFQIRPSASSSWGHRSKSEARAAALADAGHFSSSRGDGFPERTLCRRSTGAATCMAEISSSDKARHDGRLTGRSSLTMARQASVRRLRATQDHSPTLESWAAVGREI